MVQDARQSEASQSTGGNATGALVLCITCAKYLKGKHLLAKQVYIVRACLSSTQIISQVGAKQGQA